MASKLTKVQQSQKRKEISDSIPYVIGDARFRMTNVVRKIENQLEEVEERLKETFKENLDE